MKIFFLFFLFYFSTGWAYEGELLSPKNNGWVLDAHIPVAFVCSKRPSILINGQNLPMAKTPFKNLWYGRTEWKQPGAHAISIVSTCHGQRQEKIFKINFFEMHDLTPAKLLAQNFLQKHSPTKLKWDWGDALFLYGLGRLPPDESYSKYLRDYQAYYYFNPATIDWADRCPSALSALALWRQEGHAESFQNLMRVLEFIRHVPKNSLGAINHFGIDTWMSKIFPASIWLDSLMMYALLTVEAGVDLEQKELLDFGLNQQIIFAKKMQDPITGAYYHAWNVKHDRPFPKNNIFWLRGNGWVGASLVLMLEKLMLAGVNHPLTPRLGKLAQNLALSFRRVMPVHFIFDTVLTQPGKGYEELSGSALIGFFFVRGAQLKILSPDYFQRGVDIYSAITARLSATSNGLSMPDISGPTMPYPEVGYKIIPRGRDYSYGIAAYLLLAQAIHSEK